MTIEIKTLHASDEQALRNAGPGVFDDPIHEARTQEFLQDPRHHLIVAVDGELIVGFISAVHYVHPDKTGPELWINEVSVAETHRRQGVGKAMLQMVTEVARRIGCREAWVLTNRDNTAAMRLYASGGGIEGEADVVMFTFYVDADDEAEPSAPDSRAGQ